MLQYMLPFPIKTQKPNFVSLWKGGALSKQNSKRTILSIFLNPRFSPYGAIHAKIIKI